jgi:RHS repeat-associated protein
VGGVRQLTDPYHNIIKSYAFEPFGRLLAEAGRAPNDFVLPATYMTMAPSMSVYLSASRAYDPNAGRFCQRDHLIDAQASASSYSFGQADPLLVLDPGGAKEMEFIVYSEANWLTPWWGYLATGHPGKIAIAAWSINHARNAILARLKDRCDCIKSLEFWVHGNVGFIRVGPGPQESKTDFKRAVGLVEKADGVGSRIQVSDFRTGGTFHHDLTHIRKRMCKECFVYFRACYVFRGPKGGGDNEGLQFAIEAASFFGCTVGGYTEKIIYGISEPGYRQIGPGERQFR